VNPLEFAASCVKLSAAVSMSSSTAIPRAPAGEQTARKCPNPDAKADGSIRMLMHGYVGRFCTCGRFLANAPVDFFAAFQSGGETLAGFPDFLPGHIGGRGHQSAPIVGELPQVITGCLSLCFHNFPFRSFVVLPLHPILGRLRITFAAAMPRGVNADLQGVSSGQRKE
jgi:hypothetical protein